MRKKIKLLTLMPMLFLTSCTELSPYGSYSFSLGRVGDTKNRIAITMKLTDENYFDIDDPTIRLGNKFNLSFQLPAEGDIGFIGELLKNVEGYYKISELEHPKLGNRVSLGAQVPFGESKIVIPPTALEYLCVCYLNEHNFSINIPVSIDDAKYQLAWYGLYVDLKDGQPVIVNLCDKAGGEEYLPGSAHGEERFGTHPTTTNIDEMNTHFADVFSNTHFYVESSTVAGTYEEYASVYRTKSDVSEDSYFYFFVPNNISELDVLKSKSCYYRVWNSESGSYYYKQIEFDIFEPRLTPIPSAIITTMRDPTKAEKTIIDRDKFFSDYFETPFTFRDFHTLNIGLIKETN